MLVHCTAGVSRSATICVAFMMLRRGYKASVEATKLLRSSRKCVHPNRGFRAQLLEAEDCSLCRLARRTPWIAIGYDRWEWPGLRVPEAALSGDGTRSQKIDLGVGPGQVNVRWGFDSVHEYLRFVPRRSGASVSG